MDILLLENLSPDAVAWLQSRYSVASHPIHSRAPSDLRAMVRKARAIVLPAEFLVTRDFLEFAPQLKVVARVHLGRDNTDLSACMERRVRVIHGSSAAVRSNAEYLLTTVLLLHRRAIAMAVAGQTSDGFGLGREVQGTTIGLLGVTPTTLALAPLLRALGAKLVGYDPAVHHSAPVWGQMQIQAVALPELLARSNTVSVQLRYASRYRNFVNANLLEHCRPGQNWVSITGSALFDPQALAIALTDGRIESCTLDGADAAFAAVESPLHGLPNLYLTSSQASNTREFRERASWLLANQIHETLDNQRIDKAESLVPEQYLGDPGQGVVVHEVFETTDPGRISR